MTTTTKKTTAPAKAQAEQAPKPPRAAAPKKSHVLYQSSGPEGLTDVRIFGDRTRAWEALATTHTGADGWKYVAVEVGASVADAIATTQAGS